MEGKWSLQLHCFENIVKYVVGDMPNVYTYLVTCPMLNRWHVIYVTGVLLNT